MLSELGGGIDTDTGIDGRGRKGGVDIQGRSVLGSTIAGRNLHRCQLFLLGVFVDILFFIWPSLVVRVSLVHRFVFIRAILMLRCSCCSSCCYFFVSCCSSTVSLPYFISLWVKPISWIVLLFCFNNFVLTSFILYLWRLSSWFSIYYSNSPCWRSSSFHFLYCLLVFRTLCVVDSQIWRRTSVAPVFVALLLTRYCDNLIITFIVCRVVWTLKM